MAEMTSVCPSCELKSKYKYWHEIPPTKQSFFKVMYGNFHDQMGIPTDFMEFFNGKLGEWCILTGPSGKEWRVRITRAFGKTLFSEGWAKFVKDNGIMCFDYLVFSYCGDSAFQVLIYKKTGCERESAYFSFNSSSSTPPEICFNSLHIQQDHASFNDFEESRRFEEDQDHDNDNDDDDDDAHNEKNESVSQSLSERPQNDKGKSPKNVEELNDSSEDDDDDDDDDFVLSFRPRGEGSTSRGCKQPKTVHISRRRVVTWTEEQRASNSASNFVVKNEFGRPMITLTMLPTHVYQGFHMTIPKKWAKKHLYQVDHGVKLRVPGIEGSWMIGCRWTPLSQCQFRSGWSSFVLDNNLEDHDVCVFELVRKGDLNTRKTTILNVHIFRVVAEVVPLKRVRKFN